LPLSSVAHQFCTATSAAATGRSAGQAHRVDLWRSWASPPFDHL
jgi:hypothetical protein